MARNYRGISEFCSKDSLDSLEHFDDEYFVVLRRNRPVLAAFPSSMFGFFSEGKRFSVKEVSVTDLQRKNLPELSGEDVALLIRDNAPYYCIVAYSPELVEEASARLLDMVAAEKSSYFLSVSTQA